MDITDQVIALEQSKKLLELGFERSSERYNSEELLFQYGRNGKWDGYRCEDYDVDIAYPAYTASELMDILPDKFLDYYLTITKGKELYYISYKKFKEFHHRIIGNNLAQALGDMLIYLLENNYIEGNYQNE